MKERWKSILVTGGTYEVSNLGRVKRVIPSARPQGWGVFILKNSLSFWGYAVVGLQLPDQSTRQFKVHLLVAAAFLGPCPKGMEVNHKDLDKGNPRLDNLEYLTKSGNQKHAYENGAYNTEAVHKGRKIQGHALRKLIKSGGFKTPFQKWSKAKRRAMQQKINIIRAQKTAERNKDA